MKICLSLVLILSSAFSVSAIGGGCDAIHCASGQECVLQHVQCIEAPCPAVPMCAPMAKKKLRYGECEVNHCAKNQDCIAQEVQCKKAPCPAIEECVDRK